MDPIFTKKSCTLAQVLEDARHATDQGGRLMVDALAKGFGLWERFQRRPPFDPGKNQSRGCFP